MSENVCKSTESDIVSRPHCILQCSGPWCGRLATLAHVHALVLPVAPGLRRPFQRKLSRIQRLRLSALFFFESLYLLTRLGLTAVLHAKPLIPDMLPGNFSLPSDSASVPYWGCSARRSSAGRVSGETGRAAHGDISEALAQVAAPCCADPIGPLTPEETAR